MAKNKIRFNLMVAVAQNQGIGYQGGLPWPRLRRDLKFMADKTTKTSDSTKQNAVIMGRKTWESIPTKLRPLKGRYNVVLSSKASSSEIPGADMVCSSLSSAVDSLDSPPLSTKIESVYILGGSSVYAEAMDSPLCGRIYVTEVLAVFPADTFFPPIDRAMFEEITDSTVPQGVIEEHGVKYQFKVYQRTQS